MEADDWHTIQDLPLRRARRKWAGKPFMKTSMRDTTVVAAMIVFAFGGSAQSADAMFDKELNQLTERKEKEVAAALEPINRRYRASLQQLLDRARKANASDAVARISGAIVFASMGDLPPPPELNFDLPVPQGPSGKPALEKPAPGSGKSQWPVAKSVPGKPGYVTSPYAPNAGYIDLRGFPPGTAVKDPYSGKIFLVP